METYCSHVNKYVEQKADLQMLAYNVMIIVKWVVMMKVFTQECGIKSIIIFLLFFSTNLIYRINIELLIHGRTLS